MSQISVYVLLLLSLMLAGCGKALSIADIADRDQRCLNAGGLPRYQTNLADKIVGVSCEIAPQISGARS